MDGKLLLLCIDEKLKNAKMHRIHVVCEDE